MWCQSLLAVVILSTLGAADGCSVSPSTPARTADLAGPGACTPVRARHRAPGSSWRLQEAGVAHHHPGNLGWSSRCGPGERRSGSGRCLHLPLRLGLGGCAWTGLRGSEAVRAFNAFVCHTTSSHRHHTNRTWTATRTSRQRTRTPKRGSASFCPETASVKTLRTVLKDTLARDHVQPRALVTIVKHVVHGRALSRVTWNISVSSASTRSPIGTRTRCWREAARRRGVGASPQLRRGRWPPRCRARAVRCRARALWGRCGR